MNPLSAIGLIHEFLGAFPSASRRRGKHIFADGGVLEVACTTVDVEFSAVVRGGGDYEVLYDYSEEDNTWNADCSCSEGIDCKHAFAGMLALQANAAKLDKECKLVLKAGAGNPNSGPGRGQSTTARQPASTPLVKALAAALGRPLARAEADYVHRVQWLFENVRRSQPVTLANLSELSFTYATYHWEAVKLWEVPPADDLELWLYLAWELQKRHWEYPAFMQAVTDFTPIRSAIEERERNQRIQEWQQSLAASPSHAADASPVDLRVMIFDDGPVIQWSTVADPKIRALKRTHLHNFGTAYRNGGLSVVPEAIPIWLAIYGRYDDHRATDLNYEDAETIRILNQLIRVPALATRMLGSNGSPLERRAERLRYQVSGGLDERDEYHLGLVLPDGSPTPAILAALPGAPPLYLTMSAVFEGPPPHRFGMREPIRIPSPALETANGVHFLRQHRIDLPPRLNSRVRTVKTAVRVSCELEDVIGGGQLALRVTARREGKDIASCGGGGWEDKSGRPGTFIANGKPDEAGGVIYVEDKSTLQHFPGILQNLGAKWEKSRRGWFLKIGKKFPDIFIPWLQMLPPEVEVRLDRVLATLRDSPVTGSVNLDVQEAGVDWFDLKVTLNVTDTELTPEELKLLLNARGGFVRLGGKGWRRLQYNITDEEDKTLANLGLNARDFTAEPQRLHALQLADQAARKFLPEVQAEQIHRRASELKARVTPAVPPGIRAQLRPYQVEGFHFLAYLTANRFGGVLADDMGLGKTLQTLTWLSWLRGGSADVLAAPANSEAAAQTSPLVILPSLVVCPKSVTDNWRVEAQKFCSGIRVRVWEGEECTALEMARAEADLIVLNYAQLRSLSPQIAQHRWQAVILDEAQYIKNPDSQTAQAARALQADHRLALTGTPIENRLLDLWSIFAFAMPGVLGNRAQFGRQYNQQDDPLARRRLAARVRPFLLRRAKSQVAKDLPDRAENDHFCEMEGEQKTLYRAEFKRAQQMLLSVTTQKELNEQRFNFLTSLLRLRQICCHPALVNQDLLKSESAKLNALLELVDPLIEEGHKVLVFSQFVTMLDILRDTMKQRGWAHFYLAGDTENRGELVEQFQTAKGAAVFLLSLKAGGFGLNLTAASYVVLFDPWWNPAVENQAIDRTHRIGQTGKVMAYRLLIKNSIEQKIRQLQQSKAALAEDVLGEERFAQSLTLDDLRFLFSSG